MVAEILPEPFRAAIYYAPERNDPLWQAGCAWLGHDPEILLNIAQPDIAGISNLTANPKRYGFHATLKPPMNLAHGYRNFLQDVQALAASLKIFTLPELKLVDMEGTLAICTAQPSPQLHHLADICVKQLDHHRLPEDATQQVRRAAGRTERQIQNISRFGYPYVLDDWQFHMTLSQQGASALKTAAEQHFRKAMQQQRTLSTISIFIEPTPGAQFKLAARLPLAG